LACPVCGSEDLEPVLHYPSYPAYIKPIPVEMLDRVPLFPLEIWICGCCAQVHQAVPFGQEVLARIYQEVYASYHSPLQGGIGAGLARDFLRFLEVHADPGGKHVLEIGCYDGYLLSLLREHHGCRVMGCDPSPGAAIAASAGIPVRQDFFSATLFPDGYDLVVMRGLLEHIPEPVGFLAEAGRVLSGGGLLAIEVPSLTFSLENGVIGDFFHEHISYFTLETLGRCLWRGGFVIIAREEAGPYLMVLAQRLVSPGEEVRGCAGREEIPEIKSLFRKFSRLTHRMAGELREILRDAGGSSIYLYGGGGHTIGLLARVHGFLRPAGVIDGDPAKKGKYIPGFGIPVFDRGILPTLDLERSIIIISSQVFQEEIVEELRPFIEKGLRVITLYHNVEYVKPPNSIRGKDGNSS